eukprot:Seg2596.1 transcript_id=Seg2596.1/GoldUCD/mRNA.D3Y31 product="Sodium channel modifier 1" protein_id=Seg2596.1/GoldUCD/D3Y31
MAFKLSDDSNSSHNKLNRKRRVDTLLGEYVPDTEYLISRSGKYCCRVCPHWPVFDTITMLKSHRESSKHLRNFEEWEKAKVKSALQTAGPGSHCGGSQMKDTTSCSDDFEKQRIAQAPLVEKARMLIEEGVSQQKDANISCTCFRREATHFDEKKRKRWTPFFQTSYEHKNGCPKKLMMTNKASETEKPKGNIKVHVGVKQTKHDNDNPSLYAKNSWQANRNFSSDETESNPESGKSACNKNPPTYENHSLMKYYTKMKQSGWLMGPDGNWKRDDDCEFDSDDEPPKFDEGSKWDI